MTTLERLYAEALELSEHEREILADLLRGSIESDATPLSEAWKAEFARRLRDIDEGRERLIEADDALAAMFPRRAG